MGRDISELHPRLQKTISCRQHADRKIWHWELGSVSAVSRSRMHYMPREGRSPERSSPMRREVPTVPSISGASLSIFIKMSAAMPMMTTHFLTEWERLENLWDSDGEETGRALSTVLICICRTGEVHRRS